MRNITVATKIAVAIMFVAVAALGATLLYGAFVREGLTRTALEARFSAASAAKADELSRYLRSVESGTLQLASSEMTIDAARRFSTTYSELPGLDTLSDEVADTLLPLYRDEFVPALEAARGHSVPTSVVMPSTDAAQYLQSVYFGVASADEVPPILIDDALDGSSWTEVHRELHPSLRASAIALGLSDVLIVDPDNGVIVYSMAKKTDFATSLEIGPVGGTSVSWIVDAIIRNPVRGTVVVADFSRYNPDLAAPMAFVGSPILDGSTLVGVLVAKISSDEISRITTQDADWKAMQLGETGEIFVVGADGFFRSDSRLFLEEPDQYLEAATEAGSLNEGAVPGVESAETTALFQEMDAKNFDAIEESNGEMIDSTSYLGQEVFSTLRPLENAPLDWGLVVQIEKGEALATSESARTLAGISVALFVLLLTFVASIWAEAFIRPVRVLTMRLHAIAKGKSNDDSVVDLDKERTRTTREFASLTDTINTMLVSLADREHRAETVEAERRDVVRRFLPEEVARQVESGDRSVEHIEHATVVAVVIGGIGKLVGTTSREVARDQVEQMIDTLDETAVLYGMRRVKVVGDAWVAVCGLDTPHVDHVARSIRFALAAIDTTDENDGPPDTVDASVGVATGAVSAGLAGSDRLMYDAWGPTVTEAGRLARIAPPASILVSNAVADELPPEIRVSQQTDDGAARPGWSIDVDATIAGVSQ